MSFQPYPFANRFAILDQATDRLVTGPAGRVRTFETMAAATEAAQRLHRAKPKQSARARGSSRKGIK